MPLILSALLTLCAVTDGDTIRCGDERIRLLGIDAPELHGCRRGRTCVEGDGQASKRSLEQEIEGKSLRIERVGKDRYGRTLGVVYGGPVSLSCIQIRRGRAAYVEKWDNGHRVGKECRQ